MADLALYVNFLEHARLIESQNNRRRSEFLRNPEVAFQMPDSEFIHLYRIRKDMCQDLIEELEPYLPSRQNGISTVLTALSFYASGSYQRYIGASAHHKMHQMSVSNCIRSVSQALNNTHFRQKYIYFPKTREERNIIRYGFYVKFGMPSIVGCINGTHIAIVRLSQYEERYFNRKRYHSLNAQIVFDVDMNILSIDASHGGANHDSFIWNHHPLKSHLERLHDNFDETVWFLADSGYARRRTVMTPIVDTEPNSPERHYTDLHCKIRNIVERCIGVLKSLSRRSLLVDRKLHYDPTTAGMITNACVVLHNIANKARLPDFFNTTGAGTRSDYADDAKPYRKTK